MNIKTKFDLGSIIGTTNEGGKTFIGKVIKVSITVDPAVDSNATKPEVAYSAQVGGTNYTIKENDAKEYATKV